MRIRRVNSFRLKIPFREAFGHATASRSYADTILIQVESDDGLSGWGEIQARPYVTGESNEAIWIDILEKSANELLGQSFSNAADVRRLVDAAIGYNMHPALCGGFDLALLNLSEQTGTFSWDDYFGVSSSDKTAKCRTMGFEVETDLLVKQARAARISGHSIFKLKVGMPDDVKRIHILRDAIGSTAVIRLDGNGGLDLASAVALLNEVKGCNIQSLEEPLDKSSASLKEDLQSLYQSSGVDLVADESVFLPRHLEDFFGYYQVCNVRVAKCGGVTGTKTFLDAARAFNYKIVCGTMVGESDILLRVSRELLQRCPDIVYVEGIEQNKRLLVCEPVFWDFSESAHTLKKDEEAWGDCLIDTKNVS